VTGAVAIEVSIDASEWEKVDIEAIAQTACDAGAETLGLGPLEVSLLATSDTHISALNEQFRGKSVPTNVLSWPTEELAGHSGDLPKPPTDPEIGDIALSYETCVQEAAEQGKSVHDHVTHLVLHGFLHLLGYDHVRDEDATVMEGLEIKALERLGIENPYR
jgi:probable rRNA maturation factor